MSQFVPKPFALTPAQQQAIGRLRFGIAVARWNGHITETLLHSALQKLQEYGVDLEQNVSVQHVPGAIELTYAAARLSQQCDAVIVFGCVIKGDTPHFDYVCQSVTQGVTRLNTRDKAPVIFGVLTVNTEQQALDRIAGGCVGDKGAEAAEAAIEMAFL